MCIQHLSKVDLQIWGTLCQLEMHAQMQEIEFKVCIFAVFKLPEVLQSMQCTEVAERRKHVRANTSLEIKSHSCSNSK